MQTKEILKKLRKEKNYSAQQVADGCSMSIGVYKKYESGERGVGTPALCKLADFYNVSTDYLLGRTPVEQMATEEPDVLTKLTQLFQLSELEKALLQTYIAISPKERKKFVQNIEDTIKQKEATQQAPETPITQVKPQIPPQSNTPSPPKPVEPSAKPDIQISQMRNSEYAIARGGNGMYKPVPTDEQIASLTPVPEDSGL